MLLVWCLIPVPVPPGPRYLEEPTVIAAFAGKPAGKHVVQIACGSTYSAAITAEGELYTWGRGNYGRLGHGWLFTHTHTHTQIHLSTDTHI